MERTINKPKQLFNGTNIFCRVEFLVSWICGGNYNGNIKL